MYSWDCRRESNTRGRGNAMNKPILRLQCASCGLKSMKHRVYIGKMEETAQILINAGWDSSEKAFYCPVCAQDLSVADRDGAKKTRKLIFREIMHVMYEYIEDIAEQDLP